MKIGIVIRTYNEARYLGELLDSINKQATPANFQLEVTVVDSGSSDNTREIAVLYGASVVSISKEEFTFGYSLNVGCRESSGDVLVFISGHCVPVNDKWLVHLVTPIISGSSHLCYGRQVGGEHTKFSEHIIFEDMYPEETKKYPDKFLNNANAAISRKVFDLLQFDESLPGLEDVAYVHKLNLLDCFNSTYVPEACVFHYHFESFRSISIRFEREAAALRQIDPLIYLGFSACCYLFIRNSIRDICKALHRKKFSVMAEIFSYRCAQYIGVFKGNKTEDKINADLRNRYYYGQIK